ncbi:sulfite exporter TauE/SafE family protein [Leeia oryzae]|uniref:sulfite exporter TauE/SafE family protein n=1 Tax=Leeia oryzae TaxID=356662 RepID=UPI0003777B03|nr:sulfite exporter TauE/SafE family protein [Leeia oryzae]
MWMFLLIGVSAGVASGLFGIGGGVLIVPALIYFAKFSQHAAVGTSLAILLPPVGIGAAYQYYQHGNVDLRAALIVAAAFMVGGWLGGTLASQLQAQMLKLMFGVFVLFIGGHLILDAIRQV